MYADDIVVYVSVDMFPPFVSGTCIKTTVSWSWPVSLRRRWTAGRLLSYELECTLNAAWYNSLLLLHYYMIIGIVTLILLVRYYTILL